MTNHFLKKALELLLNNKYLVLIICLSLFLRIYHLPDTAYFAWDQERDAIAVNQLLIDKKPPLIGPRVMNDSGFMLGPYFFYILAPFYLILNFSPYSIILFAAFYTVTFNILSYLVIKKTFNKKISIIFIFLWAISPLTISIDKISWNPTLIPLLTILLIYLLSKLNYNKNTNLLFLGAYLGFAFNIHVQLAILSLIALSYIVIRHPKKIFDKKLPLLAFGFILSFLPLIIFDLRHNFVNFHLLKNFLNASSLSKDYFSFLPVWNNFSQMLLRTNLPYQGYLLWFLVLALLYKFSIKNLISRSFLVSWLFFPIVFAFYGNRPSEYYFNFTLPIIILVLSQTLSLINLKKVFLYPLVILLVSLSLYYKFFDAHVESFSLKNKVTVAKYIVQSTNGEKYNLSYSVPHGRNTGYEYILKYLGHPPSGDTKDPLIQIIIPAQSEYPSFGDVSIRLPPSFIK